MRHVLVTGAGGGLGTALCGLLTAAGDTVFATDADADGLRRLGGRPRIVPLRMDVTATRDVERARTKLAASTDGLDAIVCCAGIFRAGSLVEVDEAAMARSLDINVLGAFRTVRAFFPLLEARRGTVVLIGTEMTSCPMPFTGPYMVSKCALQALADTLRRELMLLGMHVVVVQPGAIRTPLLSSAGSMIAPGRGRPLFTAPLELIRGMLLREWQKGMEPVEVARVVVRALGSRRPRPVYRVGTDRLRGMLGMLPARWTDALIRAFLWFASRITPSPARRSASGATRAPRCAARARRASPRG
jgi:NAD(P)-dependent dehydrogenase (short-subunit alcohol dehydrogenase family)